MQQSNKNARAERGRVARPILPARNGAKWPGNPRTKAAGYWQSRPGWWEKRRACRGIPNNCPATSPVRRREIKSPSWPYKEMIECSGGTVTTSRQPPLQGSGTLTGWASGDDAFDGDVFVKNRPMHPFATRDKSEMLSFSGGGMKEPRIPPEWRGNGTSVGKFDDERTIRDVDGRGFEAGVVKDQSSHANVLKVTFGVVRVNGKAH